MSKDETLTKAHVRFLENRLLVEATSAGRFMIEQNQANGARLPESDREDMEVFLTRIRQLLPVLGSDLLIPVAHAPAKSEATDVLFCRIKDAEARGRRTPDGFVVFRGSSAVLKERPSASQAPYVVASRKLLVSDGTLVERDGVLVFTKDVPFSSPSAAAAIIHGGSANGLETWKTKDGIPLKDLDEK